MAYPPSERTEGIDPDPALTERGETARRPEDANLHYVLMHVWLDDWTTEWETAEDSVMPATPWNTP